MKERYFEIKKKIYNKIKKEQEKEQKLMNLRNEWFKKEFNQSFETYVQFDKIPMFTSEQIEAIPLLKELCTKNNDVYPRLNQRKKESKQYIESWKQLLKDNNFEHLLLNNGYGLPPTMIIQKHIRSIFPDGYVRFVETNNNLYAETSATSVNTNLTEKEITKIEFLEHKLQAEKERDNYAKNN